MLFIAGGLHVVIVVMCVDAAMASFDADILERQRIHVSGQSFGYKRAAAQRQVDST